jgi:hypothetical protein
MWRAMVLRTPMNKASQRTRQERNTKHTSLDEWRCWHKVSRDLGWAIVLDVTWEMMHRRFRWLYRSIND